MPKQTIILVPVVLAIAVVAVASAARSCRAEPAADDCLTKPNSASPQGSHWYYRVDRTTNRRCWYLGPEGMKVRQAAAPRRIPPATPTAQPTEEISARPSQNGLVADASTPWSALPKSAGSTDRGQASMSDSNADGHTTGDSQDDMSLIWPVLTPADLAAAERPAVSTATEPAPEFAATGRAPKAAAEAGRAPASTVRPEHMLAIAAGVLMLVTIIFRTILFAVRQLRLRRRNVRDHWRSAAHAARPRKLVAPASASTVAAGRQADVVRESAATPRRLGVAREPLNAGGASEHSEEDFRRLLDHRQRRAA